MSCGGRPRLALTRKPAMTAPMHCEGIYSIVRGNDDNFAQNVDIVINGLKWPPEIGPPAKMNNGSRIRVVTEPIIAGTIGPREVAVTAGARPKLISPER